MNNIDEDIKIVEEMINNCKECKFATCEQCEINYVKIQAISNILSELETYKKIAEKLAEILSVKLLETLGVKPNIEDLIESAKSEVLKDGS